ncbi:hypothetical protein ONZ45_g1638 [Pleurotus djamor]|nr:hypothetical protein ONZ45_g1638 [Pleurotus djamor]
MPSLLNQPILRGRRKRSSLPKAIHEVPVEILLRIFKLAVEVHNTYDDKFKARSWLMSVCRLWRDAIRDTPGFWLTFIGLEAMPCLDDYIRRAKQFHVDIRGHPELPFDLPRATKVLKLIDRVKVLQFAFKYDDFYRIEKLLSSPTTSLEVVRIEVKCRRTIDDVPITVQLPPAFEDNIFGGLAQPNLKVLELRFCEIAWTAPLLSSCGKLTDLRLESQPHRPTYAVFVSVFSGLQALRRLHITFSLPDDARLDPSHKLAIDLPNLRYVYIEDDVFALAIFFFSIKCRLRSLCVDACNHEWEEEDFTHATHFMISAMRTLDGAFSQLPVTNFQVMGNSHQSYEIIKFSGINASGDGQPVYTTHFTITFAFTIPRDARIYSEALLRLAFTKVPVCDVTTLQYELGFNDIDWDLWSREGIAMHMPNVKQMDLSKYAYRSFVHAATSTTEVLFPRLKKITAPSSEVARHVKRGQPFVEGCAGARPRPFVVISY